MLAAAALAVSVDFFRQLVLPDRRQRSARRQVEVHAELGATGGAETQKIERAIRRAGSHRRALTARLTSSARRLRLTLASDLPGTIWRVGRGRDRLLGAARTLRGLPLLAGVILLRAAVHTARYLGDAVGLADGDLCLFLRAVGAKQIAESKRRIGLQLICTMRTHVARDRRRGLQVRTVGSLRNPIFERRGIDVGTEQERLFAFTELVDLGVGALVDANDLAFFIDPDRRWDIHEIEHATDDVVFINNLHGWDYI